MPYLCGWFCVDWLGSRTVLCLGWSLKTGANINAIPLGCTDMSVEISVK